MARKYSYQQAKNDAQANADFFRLPFVVFQDISGNTHCEMYDSSLACHKQGEVFSPKETNHGS